MKFLSNSIDVSKVHTLIYHLPDGQTMTIQMVDIGQLLDLDLELGRICDTSDIDGVVHFFPHGNA